MNRQAASIRRQKETTGGMPVKSIGIWIAALLAGALTVLPIDGRGTAQAESVADFYQGKRITMYIGSSAGGGTDLYGRLVANFIGRHIPGNPTVVAANVPGANGLVAANQLFNIAAKDGTAIGTFGRYAVFEALWKNKAALFVPERFNWIGNVQVDISTCVTWHTTGVSTLSDFMTRDLKMGATTESHVNILNNVFGAKLRAIKGYPGGNDITIALERGEVDGRCNWSWSAIMSTRPDWVRDKKINVVLQFSNIRVPELQDVPLVTELVKTESQKEILNLILTSQQMARLVAAPPDIPPERVAALRKAFDDTMKDPEFQASAARLGLPIEPVSGLELQKLVTDMSKTPPDVIKTFHEVVGGDF
jgi:tripartite-type tricarboxylate transporter receptor subunit TctC